MYDCPVQRALFSRKFTGKERDPETNNDDFDARYYSSTYGRFLSSDWSAVPAPVPYANLTNPQTLNLYAIVSDNPESFADLDGHDPIGSDPAFKECEAANCPQTEVAGGDQNAVNTAAQQNQNPDQPQGETQPNQTDQPQQPDPPKPPSWDPTKPLPGDPKDLGPDWKPDPSHKAPNDKRYVNPKGDKLDWHKGIPGEKKWMGKDHWHWNEHDWHFKPGDRVESVATAIAVGVIVYWVVSESSRLFPLRNLVPVP
jgi:RHS repeat-associated protein